jgi:hypothetical protein
LTNLRSACRRGLTVLGAALLATVAMSAVATPAHAHTATIEGTAECDSATGEWVVTWTVRNDFPAVATIEDRASTPEGAELDLPGEIPPSGEITGTQRVGADQDSASLSLTSHWIKNEDDPNDDVKFPASGNVGFDGTCDAPEAQPSASFDQDCESVTATMANEGDKEVELTVLAKAGDEDATEVEKVMLGAGESKSVSVPVTDEEFVVSVADGEDVLGEHTWEFTEDCAQELVGDVEVKTTCDDVTVTLSNPNDEGTMDLEFEVTGPDGKTETVTVPAGQSMTKTFDAEDGKEVTVALGEDSKTFPVELPEDCDQGGGGGSLPVTGVKLPLLGGAAALLLLLGVGLTVVARRRKAGNAA